jgi:hypothetical protein
MMPLSYAVISINKFFYLVAAKEKFIARALQQSGQKSREGAPLIKRSPDLLPSLD